MKNAKSVFTLLLSVSLVTALGLSACKKKEEAKAPEQAAPATAPAKAGAGLPPDHLPLGLDGSQAVIPEDNPITPEKVELGRLLYFDGRLSRDGTISCSSCHHPAFWWSDPGPTSTGIRGQKGGRRAPTIINRLFTGAQFWDGRAPSLEEQAKGPIINPIEMGFTPEEVVARLSGIAEYGPYFEKAFGSPGVDIDKVAKAIATFERTIVAGNSPFDKWQMNGDQLAVSQEAQRGFAVFREKARCGLCHAGQNFADEQYHNLGVGMDKKEPDLGRFAVTKEEEDKGAFKTPTLRNLRVRAPYMHDGSHKTLEEVIDLYDKGGVKNPHLSPLIKPIGLTPKEKKELLAFLQTLDGEVTQVDIPKVFPGGWRPGDPVQ